MKRKLSVLLLVLLAFALFADDMIFHYVDGKGHEMLGEYTCKSGKLEKVEKLYKGANGYRLTATQKGDKSWSAQFIRGHRVCTPAVWGRKYTVEVVASGKGKLVLGEYQTMFRYTVNTPPKTRVVSEEFELTDEWKTYTAEIQCLDAGVWRGGLMVEVRGENAVANIASANLTWVQNKQQITAYPRHIVAYPGMKLAADFTLERDADLKVFDGVAFSDAKSTNKKIHVDAAPGVAELDKVDAASHMNSAGRFGVYSDVDASAADVMITMLPEDEWKSIDAIASKIKFDKPQRILFIADSLSDFDRGVNFVDKFEFWLNLHNPHKCFIHNAGIGGNYIEWVYNCLSGKSNYREHMYKGLFDKEWDRIFIFLGQNDTRHHYQANVGKPDFQPVPEEKHADYLRGVIKLLQEKSKAKITLVSPISTDWEASARSANYAKEKGRAYVIFGEPDRVEAYFKTVRDVAAEFNLDVIDIYNPVKELKNKSELFTPDGVHLSVKGHNYFSIKLLEYMTAQ